jgi:hypothetical protein
MPTCIDISEIRSPLVHSLHRWWAANKGPAGLPDRSNFDPLDHKHILANMMISELEPDPFRVRYRLVGTKVASTTGFDFTGRYLDDLLGPQTPEPWIEYHMQVASTRAPLLGNVREPTRHGGDFKYEFGIFPVTNGGLEVAQFISVEDYFGSTLIGASLNPWPPPLS